VTKHANASRVSIELDVTHGSVLLKITDNGKGFNVERARAESELSFGLTSMQERVTSLGGRLIINSQPGEGTQVRADIPLDES